MDTWQKCPVCDGKGSVWSPYGTGQSNCNACNGHGILNIITGLPPAGMKSWGAWTTTDIIYNSPDNPEKP